uniref:PNPLA domain-containing protein n=1 Tax=mine drainage metagenome TaxID=410659 RepID=E6PDM3_9ZZZZ
MRRTAFLSSMLGVGGALAAPTTAAALPDEEDARAPAALVLSGGGARGAYEAGVIEALRRRAGIGDGEPLPPYRAVFGSSIGAINGSLPPGAIASSWRSGGRSPPPVSFDRSRASPRFPRLRPAFSTASSRRCASASGSPPTSPGSPMAAWSSDGSRVTSTRAAQS